MTALALLALLVIVNGPVVSETFEVSPGTDLTWYPLSGLPPGNPDAVPPAGAVDWEAECLAATADAGAYTLFNPARSLRLEFDLYLAPDLAAETAAFVHVGSTSGTLPSLFVWIETVDGARLLTLMDGGTVLAQAPIAPDFHHVIVEADAGTGLWSWSLDGQPAGNGRQTWAAAPMNGLSYAVWDVAAGQAFYLDNLMVVPGAPARRLYMPVIGGGS